MLPDCVVGADVGRGCFATVPQCLYGKERRNFEVKRKRQPFQERKHGYRLAPPSIGRYAGVRLQVDWLLPLALLGQKGITT